MGERQVYVNPNLPKNVHGFPDMSYMTDEDWIRNNGVTNFFNHCSNCTQHAGQRRGLDCPHGYWISRERWELQMHWKLRRVVILSGLVLVAALYGYGGLAGCVVGWVLVFIIWKIKKARQERYWRQYAAHPEIVAGYWERVLRANHPWTDDNPFF